ncbi:MAG: Alginate biosynthesis sensor protein KinB [Synergistetes bacterium ADurb.Bin520]|nr:MAG: Alginate biosynthesis sensor protein KinB [Synergistetes bacterium ADurb.Bin520]
MRQIRDNLYLIDIDQALEGFRKFISAWLYRVNGATILVDPGPASTIPCLVERLKGAGVERIDHVLLTHIHLDHAGGTGHLMQHFPGARVNCHPKGIPHLAAPQKLWEESKKVLGKVDMDGIAVESRVQGIRLLADPMLENVFHTLADNTVRHGGHVTKVVVRGENVEKGVVIIWEDDGVGVPSDRKEMIFDQGFGDNTGLGLYLAREILATTGFTITEEGEPGKGARFVIRAPSGWFTWKRPPSP